MATYQLSREWVDFAVSRRSLLTRLITGFLIHPFYGLVLVSFLF